MTLEKCRMLNHDTSVAATMSTTQRYCRLLTRLRQSWCTVLTVMVFTTAVVPGESSSPSDCRIIPDLETTFTLKPQREWTGDGVGTRYIASNHKTGTLFAQCLCDVVSKPKSHGGAEIPCLAGSLNRTTHIQHTSSQGLTSSNFCINMVRNPFVMVHSGVQYHASTTNPHEKWLYHRPLDHTSFGVKPALLRYDAWCFDDKTPLNTTLNYQETMQVGSVLDLLHTRALNVASDAGVMRVCVCPYFCCS